MDLAALGENWNRLGESDPMWAVLMHPDRRNNGWAESDFFETGKHDIEYAMQSIEALRIPLRQGRSLDFGCGLGRLTQGLACYFDEACGVDIAPAMIRRAREYNPYGSRCQFFENEKDDLTLFPDDHFDFVLSLIVLQHMRPDYAKRYIAEFLRVSAPGGLVLFQMPSHYDSRPVYGNYRPLSYRIGRKAHRMLQRGSARAARWLRWSPESAWPRISPTSPRREPNFTAQGKQFRIDRPASDAPPSSAEKPPQTEVYTISRRQMVSYLKSLGARILHVEPRNECSPNHRSYRYFVTKS